MKGWQNKEITACRLCDSPDLDKVLDFGEVTLPNEYLTQEQVNQPQTTYPLTVLKCGRCGNVQLKETINPDILFKNYLYASSMSPGLVKHFEAFAKHVINLLYLKMEDFLLDIGSNDGLTLRPFKTKRLKVLGVEPAENLAAVANKEGLETINDYFTFEKSKEIKAQYGIPRVITCSNTYAHLVEHHSVTNGIKNLMDDNTVFIFENAYLLDTIKNLYFDQVYFDHLNFFGICPLMRYFSSLGMEIFRVEKTEIQGGSIRCFVKLKTNSRKIEDSVNDFAKQELDFDLYNLKTYINFNHKLELIIKNFTAAIRHLINTGRSISCFGCPAKFALFSKVFGLNRQTVQYVVDDSTLKQGRFSSWGKIPIVSKKHFKENPTSACIISAWNFAKDIIKANPDFHGIWMNPFDDLDNV